MATKVGHTGRVDCVKWLPSSGKGVNTVINAPDEISPKDFVMTIICQCKGAQA